jgi:curved DNA-binding protein CbpA
VTVGLDVLTRNAGENVRKVHARELAGNVVTALFRLVKLSTLHSLDNQAMVRQIEETVQLVAEYGQRTEHNVSILFAHGSVFVGGQLLRANRGVYEGALELGEILAKVGAAEIGVRREAQASDFYAFASVLADALRKPKPPKIERPSPNIRLRELAASAMLREELLSERVDPNVQVARIYASAVVIMRRFFEDLRRGKYDLPQRVKRVAQRLVDLSMGETPAFLGVTAARNQNYDEAGRAVNTAILALAMTRQVTTDMVQLSRLAMAALLYDCAHARSAGVVGMPPGGIIPQLSEQQENEAAAGTAVVLTALGRINEPSVMRTVISYEAHWERRRGRLGPVYRGLRPPSLQARIVNIARAFNDALTPAPGQTPPTADEAIAKLEQEATDAADRTVIRLLIGALGIFTTGTIVKLNTGETGIVVQTPAHPSLYSQPRVRLVLDARGGWLQPPAELDLAHQKKRPGEPARHIMEVVATSDDPVGAQMRAYAAGPAATSGVRMHGSPSYHPPSSQREPPSNQYNPPSHQQSSPSYQQSSPSYQQSSPSHQQQSAPSYQVTPPSYQQNPASYQLTPPSFPQQGQQQKPHPTQPPYAHYAQSQPPTPAGRASTLTTPLYDQPAPRAHAFYDDRFEVPGHVGGHAQTPVAGPLEPSGMQVEELREDDDAIETGASTRAVSWEEHQEILARPVEDEVTNAVPPQPEPEPEPDDRPKGAPTAEGTLQKTPFVHLLIYMLDQRLSGTTVFTLPNGVAHSVYFHDGTPAKVRTGTMLEPLDRVLVDEGMLDEPTLRGTLMEVSKKNILHGRLLVMKGLLDREKVVHALRIQVLRKVTHLFELPGDTRYAYYKDENLLASYGGPELTPTEPLAVIMAGIRLMASDPLVDATLAKILGRPLALHIDAEMKRFQLTREEQAVVDLMRTRKMTIKEIVHANVAQERIVRLSVYALVVTRHLDLGVAGKPPVGLGRPPISAEAIRQPEPPPKKAPAAKPAPAAAKPAPTQAKPVPEPAPAQARAPQPGVTMPGPGRQPAAAARSRTPTLGGDAAVAPPANPVAPEPMPPQPMPTRAAPRAPIDVSFGPMGQQPYEQPQAQYAYGAPPQAQPPYSAPQAQGYAPPPQSPPPYATPSQTPPSYGAPPQAPLPQRAPPPTSVPPPAAPIAAAPIVAGPVVAAPEPPKAPERPEIAARRAEIEKRAQVIDGEDYYQMLGITVEATVDQVKTAYFSLAKSWHPDRLPADLLDVKPLVARVFARFSEAYQTLTDPVKSKDYAELMKSGGGSPDDQEKVARVVDAALEFQKAEILLKKNDLLGAEQLASRAVQADPDQPEYLTLLVWIRAMRRGDPPELREGQTSTHYDDLIKLLDGILAKEKEFERALYYRGVLLKRSGRADKSIRDFRLAAQLNPKNLDAIREVRLYEMRKRGGPKGGKGGEQEGLFGKFFKR